MKRRSLLVFACAAGCLASFSNAQETRVRRVVIPFALTPDQRERIEPQIVRSFATHELQPGRDFVLEFVRVGNAPASEQEQRARELVASRPDVILTPAVPIVFVFQRLTKEIPIVFYHYGGEPVGAGLVESLRRPGANITRTSHLGIERIPKSWSLLKELRPAGKRVALLMTSEYLERPHMARMRDAMARAAQMLGLVIVELPFPRSARFDAVAALITKASPDFVDVNDDVYQMPWMDELLAYFIHMRLPALYGSASLVRRGGLLSMSFDSEESVRVAIAIAARILRGEKPATIPVYVVTRYHTAINLRTANAMSLEVPASTLLQADEVVR